jgi:tetratricopeptide (TPR) repeat protein
MMVLINIIGKADVFKTCKSVVASVFVSMFVLFAVFTSSLPPVFSQTIKAGNPAQLPWLLKSGNYPEVIRQATAIIASDPKNADAYYCRAIAYKAHKMMQYKALQDLDQAIKLNPDFAGAYSLKAVMLHEQQEDELALPAITRACELLPTDTGVLRAKAIMLNALNRPKEALVIVDKLLAHNSKHDEDHWVRSKSMFLLGRTDEGVKDLDMAVKMAPANLSFRTDRLIFNSRHKRWELVFEDADYVIAHASATNVKEAYERRATAHVGLKQYKEGIADYKSAIAKTKSDSQMRVLHVQLKQAYELAGDSKAAAIETEYIRKLDEDMRPF